MVVLEMMMSYNPLYEINSWNENFDDSVSGKNFLDVLKKNLDSLISEIQKRIPLGVPHDLRDFLIRCLKEDPKKRDSVDDLLKHKWMRKKFNENSDKTFCCKNESNIRSTSCESLVKHDNPTSSKTTIGLRGLFLRKGSFNSIHSNSKKEKKYYFRDNLEFLKKNKFYSDVHLRIGNYKHFVNESCRLRKSFLNSELIKLKIDNKN